MENKILKIRNNRALTLIEMIIALAMVSVVFAALLPQFRNIQNSWDSKRGGAEAVQNGRVLNDHITRNLSQAVSVISVSDPDQKKGRIVFQASDSNLYCYNVSADNYIEYGLVGSMSQLAGPVSQLQFTCYPIDDLSTSTTTAREIRHIQVQSTFDNDAENGKDKSFTAQAFLKANSTDNDPAIYVEPGSELEFDIQLGTEPALVQIDDYHYLNVYTGPNFGGFAIVSQVNTANWTVSRLSTLEYDTAQGNTPDVVQIDDTHFLCVYSGNSDSGRAVVLTIDKSDWSIKGEEKFKFDSKCYDPAVAKIDDTHFLCVYTGDKSDGYAVVLEVDDKTWGIDEEDNYEFDTMHCETPDLVSIDSENFLCVYTDAFGDGDSVILTVNSWDHSIGKRIKYEFDSNIAKTPTLAKVNNSTYLCAYAGLSDIGKAAVLRVNTFTGQISASTPYVYDSDVAVDPHLSEIERGEYLCVYEGKNLDAWATKLTVSGSNISECVAEEYDVKGGKTPSAAEITDDHYYVVYQGSNNDGWAAILCTEPPILP